MKNIKKKPTKQLEKFSTLFTQLGLVLVLFIVYIAIEYETEQKQLAIIEHDSPTIITIDPDQEIMFTKEPKPKPKVEQVKPTFIPDEPIKKGDNIVEETPFDLPVNKEPVEFHVDSLFTLKDDPIDNFPDDDVPFVSIEEAPVFKGCEGLSKVENKKCFDKMMNRFIQRNFDTDLANDLGLRSGKHRIFTQFIIDKKGEVVDVKIRAPHPKLKTETLQTIKKLPKFKPGKQNNRFVKVKYTLPITFQVE